jgi:hypothetical protein
MRRSFLTVVLLVAFLFSNLGSAHASAEDCRIANSFQVPAGWSINGYGFPKNRLSIPTEGTIVIPVVFITYPDLKKPSEKDAKNIYKYFSKDATNYFKNSSNGKLKLILKPDFRWITMSRPSGSYESFGNTGAISGEVYNLASGQTDLSGTHGLVAVSNPATYAPGHMFGLPAGDRSFALVGTSEFYKYPAADFIHELFHAFGLPDGQNFVGNYSIMGNSHSGTELLAWERFLLGWIKESEIECMSQGSKNVRLSPAASKKGTKFVAIKISPTEVLVIESRKPVRYDNPNTNFGNAHFQRSRFRNDGPLIYLVNSAIGDPYQGPLRILNNQKPLKLGKTFRYDNIEIKYLSNVKGSDTISVKIK